MTKADLSFLAETLLALCGREGAGLSSWERLEANERLAARFVDGRDDVPTLANRTDPTGLLAHEFALVLEASRLTRAQRGALEGRLSGLTFEQLGERDGVTKQAMQRRFAGALKKLLRTKARFRYVGLSEVYEAETRRGLVPRSFGRIKR